MKNRIVILKPQIMIIRQFMTKAILLTSLALIMLLSVNGARLLYAKRHLADNEIAEGINVTELQNDNKKLQNIIEAKAAAIEVFNSEGGEIPLELLETLNNRQDISLLSISSSSSAAYEGESTAYTVDVEGAAASNESVSALVGELTVKPFVGDCVIKGLEEAVTTLGTKYLFKLEVNVIAIPLLTNNF